MEEDPAVDPHGRRGALAIWTRRVLLGALFCVAATGWAGLRLPAPPGERALMERVRGAWNPSPVPAGGHSAAGVPGLPALPLPRAGAPSLPQPAPAAVPAAAPPLRLLPSATPVLSASTAPVSALPPDTLPLPAATAQPSEPAPAPTFTLPEGPLTDEWITALYGGTLPAQRGAWREVWFYSRALDRETSYLIWLPPGYGATQRTYPTLYLLHGIGGAEGYGPGEWLGYALTEDLDHLLALQLIEPMVVVLPDGEQGYWINQAGGGPRWADFVAQDLVAHVDATFRIDPRRERRAIGGLSMGAHGALQLTLNHLDVFGVAGAHSPTLRPFETSPDFFGDRAWFARYDPMSLLRSGRVLDLHQTQFWIDSGEQDDWRPETERLAAALLAREAPVQYHVLPGVHEGWYWRRYLPEYLRFYSTALANR